MVLPRVPAGDQLGLAVFGQLGLAATIAAFASGSGNAFFLAFLLDAMFELGEGGEHGQGQLSARRVGVEALLEDDQADALLRHCLDRQQHVNGRASEAVERVDNQCVAITQVAEARIAPGAASGLRRAGDRFVGELLRHRPACGADRLPVIGDRLISGGDAEVTEDGHERPKCCSRVKECAHGISKLVPLDKNVRSPPDSVHRKLRSILDGYKIQCEQGIFSDSAILLHVDSINRHPYGCDRFGVSRNSWVHC